MTAPTPPGGRLDEIEARLDKISHGWERELFGFNDNGHLEYYVTTLGQTIKAGSEEDADFIAAAPDDIRWLIDRVRTLEAALAVQSIASGTYRRAREGGGA